MYFLWLLVIAIIITVSANPPFDEIEDQIHGENGWYVPNSNGTFLWQALDVAEKLLETLRMENDNNRTSFVDVPVSFYLYTRGNKRKGNQLKALPTEPSLGAFSSGAATKRTFVLIHGWTNSYETETVVEIRNAALQAFDCNVIVVDWPRARSDYISAVVAIPRTGARIAEMIDFLNECCGLSFDTLTVVGHSLGAHVAGHTGKNVKKGRVHTVIGLDPALPLFSFLTPSNRLAATDGDYVQAIHTNAGVLGFLKPIVQGDFYANGGKSQPGCGSDYDGSCSHRRVTTYYAEALTLNNFGAIECKNYLEALAHNCGYEFSSTRMGGINPTDESEGSYFVPVRSSTPFGIIYENFIAKVIKL
ncbi:phospholipase A1-like [Stomoxys calcitrans]|uniref:Lipase domain-containing protein n=1 Tax=Stomoxys calcitrans TaxID=35570 RepID=A0A1I8NYW5_STOCA|nr:phospholipase A1-like [Stomoxys calcitrans]